MKTNARVWRLSSGMTSYLRRSGWRAPMFSPRPDLAGWPAVSFPPGSLAPLQVCKAYQFVQGAPKRPVKLGIGCLGGAALASDFSTAAQAWGIQVPKVTVITVDGATQVTDPNGANVENQLDIQLMAAVFSYCTGQAADITFCIAPNTGTGIAHATSALVAAGCEVISWSWGAPLSQWAPSDLAVTRAAFLAAVAATCSVCAASGDGSLDDGTSSPTCDFPCADVNVWAVGGTRLTLAADGSIAKEQAWGDGLPGDDGGGGGFAANVPMPSWQQGVVPGNLRGCPDSSLNADPASGWQIFADGAWTTVGGTSASSPATAGYIGALKAISGLKWGNMGTVLYPAIKTAFHDIVLGSNGAPTAAGWDQATGMGSVNGPGFSLALTSGVPVPVPVPVPTPTPIPTPVPTPIPTPPPVPVPPPVKPFMTLTFRLSYAKGEPVFFWAPRGIPAGTTLDCFQKGPTGHAEPDDAGCVAT